MSYVSVWQVTFGGFLLRVWGWTKIMAVETFNEIALLTVATVQYTSCK